MKPRILLSALLALGIAPSLFAKERVDLYSTRWLCGADHVTSECFKYLADLLDGDSERKDLVKRALVRSGAASLQEIVSPCAPSDRIEGIYDIAGATSFISGSESFAVPLEELANTETKNQDIARHVGALRSAHGLSTQGTIRTVDHIDYVTLAYSKALSICLQPTDTIQMAADTLTHELTHFDFSDPSLSSADPEHDLLSFTDATDYIRFVFTQPGGEADAFTRQFSALIRRDGNSENVPFIYLKSEFGPHGQFLGKLDDQNVLRSLLDGYERKFAENYNQDLIARKSAIESAIARRKTEGSSPEVQASMQRLEAEHTLVNEKIHAH